MFAQLLVNGLIAGSIYALVASGFSVIYSTNKFVHFAHGSVVAFAAYFLYFFYGQLALNFYFACLLTILCAAFLGFLLNQFVYRALRLKKATPSILLIASVALMILIESIILFWFGAAVKTVDFITTTQSIEFFGAIITPLQIIIIIVALILFLALYIFMKKTKLGKAMRAVADNKDAAGIIGISAEKIYASSFIIGSMIAGIAGIMVALEYNLQPMMGANLMIKGFAAAIIGGIGNVSGAVLGAIALGLAENFGIWFLPSGFKDAITFVMLFIFLMIRPQGIFVLKKGGQK